MPMAVSSTCEPWPPNKREEAGQQRPAFFVAARQCQGAVTVIILRARIRLSGAM